MGNKLTADEYRAKARSYDQEAWDSFERSDTDGFLSQWASGITARECLMKADLAEQGWMAKFPALFDLDGNIVPAVFVAGNYGMSWRLLDPTCWEQCWERTIGWFTPSRAENDARRVANNAKKGYYVGTVKAPADAKIMGSGRGLAGAASCYVGIYRTDRGYSPDVVIIDNGKETS